jgi:hypothetical protein
MRYASDSVEEIPVSHSIYPNRYPWPSTPQVRELLRARRSPPPRATSTIASLVLRDIQERRRIPMNHQE